MSRTLMFRSLIASLLIVANVVQTTYAFGEIDVKITNNLPAGPTSTLTLQCASNGGDRENNYTLDVEKDVEWILPNGTASYSCGFDWGAKHKGFQLFNENWSQLCSARLCYWYVKSDGFYHLDYSGGLIKIHDWN